MGVNAWIVYEMTRSDLSTIETGKSCGNWVVSYLLMMTIKIIRTKATTSLQHNEPHQGEKCARKWTITMPTNTSWCSPVSAPTTASTSVEKGSLSKNKQWSVSTALTTYKCSDKRSPELQIVHS